ncbi:BrnA antitoxin family protein [Geminicoccus harenae]|uniref:BrnA antitoxin family protein n=1 Tax=Geminicoccus harenae TaxID=2498453 RepID=UPI001CC2998E|nr:BrnA antitoxin family protein [Geminicoccus harenae]
MSPELQAEIKALEKMSDDDIDTSDIPEALDWSDAVRGKFVRPVKRQITLRLDADLIDYFEKEGKGYQTRINAALREWVTSQQKRKKTEPALS